MNDKIIQIANLTQNAKRDNPQRNRVYSPEGIAPTIYRYGGGNLEPLVIVSYGEDTDALPSRIFQGGGQWNNNYSPSLTTSSFEHNNLVLEMETDNNQLNLPAELQGKKFRIRKLTPRECLRLMDVEDPDIDKMIASGLSNSALYKLAGNSIVVAVLYHIFRKMFIETDADTTDQPQQMTLW